MITRIPVTGSMVFGPLAPSRRAGQRLAVASLARGDYARRPVRSEARSFLETAFQDLYEANFTILSCVVFPVGAFA